MYRKVETKDVTQGVEAVQRSGRVAISTGNEDRIRSEPRIIMGPPPNQAVRPVSIAVLLATHNGGGFLRAQVESILAQVGVTLEIWISDDQSSDGTVEYLRDCERLDSRLHLLPPGTFGSAADNFLRLIRDVPTERYDYVALADQDDVWLPLKLQRAVEQLMQSNADGYSCNLTAFDGRTGEEWLVRKSAPPRALDYLFGGASAGCTYVLSSRATALVRRSMQGEPAPSRGWSHDWLFHAICRSSGFRWVFDEAAPIRYRQHTGNQYGARSGLQGVFRRAKDIRSGWYRERILDNGRYLTRTIAETDVLTRIDRLSFLDRLWLFLRGWRFRRRLMEGVALSLACLVMPRTRTASSGRLLHARVSTDQR
jgi:rhamnosyltransferase